MNNEQLEKIRKDMLKVYKEHLKNPLSDEEQMNIIMKKNMEKNMNLDITKKVR